jgi:hypothetical protein
MVRVHQGALLKTPTLGNELGRFFARPLPGRRAKTSASAKFARIGGKKASLVARQCQNATISGAEVTEPTRRRSTPRVFNQAVAVRRLELELKGEPMTGTMLLATVATTICLPLTDFAKQGWCWSRWWDRRSRAARRLDFILAGASGPAPAPSKSNWQPAVSASRHFTIRDLVNERDGLAR